MAHTKKLEEVLDLLINEETEKATELLHDIVVEKARMIYEDLLDDEGMGEDFGGDIDTDYADDIQQDKDDIESDEMFNDMDDAVEGDVGEEDLETRVEDLQAQLEELEAKFAELAGEEAEEEEHADADFDDFGEESDEEGSEEESEDDEVKEGLEEATKFLDAVSIDMSGEGKFAGTGNKSKGGAVNTKSPVVGKKAPVAADADAVKFAKASGEGKNKPEAAKKSGDFGAKGNMNTDLKSKSVDMKGEGKPVGTGKGAKTGGVNTKSVLAKK
jgi:hypothetical protein